MRLRSAALVIGLVFQGCAHLSNTDDSSPKKEAATTPDGGICYRPRLNYGGYEYLNVEGGVYPPYYYVRLPGGNMPEFTRLLHAAEYEVTRWADDHIEELDKGCHTTPEGLNVRIEVFVAKTPDGQSYVTRAEFVAPPVVGNRRRAWGKPGQYVLSEVGTVLDASLEALLTEIPHS